MNIYTTNNDVIADIADIRKYVVSRNNLDNIDLSGFNLSGIDFSGYSLRGTKFSSARLIRCNFTDADMAGCDLAGAKFSYTEGNGAELRTIHIGTHTIVYTDKECAIDCTQKKIADWCNIDRDAVIMLDYKSLDLFDKYRTYIINLLTNNKGK